MGYSDFLSCYVLYELLTYLSFVVWVKPYRHWRSSFLTADVLTWWLREYLLFPSSSVDIWH